MRSSDLKKKGISRYVQGRRKVWKCGVRGFLIVILCTAFTSQKMSRKREPFSINSCFFVHKYYFLSNYCKNHRVLGTENFFGYWLLMAWNLSTVMIDTGVNFRGKRSKMKLENGEWGSGFIWWSHAILFNQWCRNHLYSRWANNR